MYFEIIGEIEGTEAIAIGGSIRDIARLRRRMGQGVGENSKVTPLFGLEVEPCIEQRYTGTKLMELVE